MGLPLWRSPSPEAEVRDAQKPSRSPIRRQRRGRREYAAAALARLSNPGSGSSSAARPWEIVRMPQRREEISRPSRVVGSQSSSSQALPPVPELRTYTRSPMPIHGEIPSPRAGRRDSPFLSEARDRVRDTIEQLDRIRARHNTLQERRRNLEVPNNPRQSSENRSAGMAMGLAEVSDLIDFERFLDDEVAAANRRRSPSPLLGSGAVDEFPPLRRMGRGPIVDVPVPPSGSRETWSTSVGSYDGLGDRSRSFTPDSDHWETMLTTIAPDLHLPSADSSFTSAAASASFSASRSHSTDSTSNSASTSRTSLTMPSAADREHEQACDTDEDGPIDPLTAGIRQRNLDRRLRRTDSIYELSERRTPRPVDGPILPTRRPIAVRAPLRSPGREPRRNHLEMSASSAEGRDAAIASREVPTFQEWWRSRGSRLQYPERQANDTDGGFVNSLRFQPVLDRSTSSGVYSPEAVEGAMNLAIGIEGRHGERNRDVAINSNDPDRNATRPMAGSTFRDHSSFNQEGEQTARGAESTERHEEGNDHDLGAGTPEEDLDSLRSIVERLARRDDIPEEWWMSVGLTPVFAQRVRRERETRERL